MGYFTPPVHDVCVCLSVCVCVCAWKGRGSGGAPPTTCAIELSKKTHKKPEWVGGQSYYVLMVVLQ